MNPGPFARSLTGAVALLGATLPLAAQTRWTIDPKPTLQIGSVDGAVETTFGSVRTALRTRDGRILVLDGKTNLVRIFDAAGKHVGLLGRKGDGPGEYRFPYWLGERADTVFLFDYNEGPGRLSRFDRSGKFVGSDMVRTGREAFGARPIRLAGDGSLLLSGSVETEGPRTPPYQASQSIVRYQRPDRVTPIGRFPGQIIRTARQFFYDDGARAASDSLLFINDGQSASIQIYGLDGVVRRAINPPFTPRKPTAADREAHIAQTLELFKSNPDLSPETERRLRETTFDWTMPVYRGWRVDTDGNLWVSVRLSLTGDESEQIVFSPMGREVARVALPAGFAPVQIGRDFILGTWKNEDDVPFVRVYRLARR